MAYIFPLLLFVIVAACIGFLYPEGMWSNAVRFINVVLAMMLATSFFEPVARLIEKQAESVSFFVDFLALWLVFILSVMILNQITRAVSEVKVRFLKIADNIGSGVFATLIGYLMVCFTVLSIHVAPLGRTAFWDGFDPMQPTFVGMRPEFQWLGFFQHASNGVFCTYPPNVFDPSGQWVNTYTLRRDKVASHAASTGTFKVNSASEAGPEAKR